MIRPDYANALLCSTSAMALQQPRETACQSPRCTSSLVRAVCKRHHRLSASSDPHSNYANRSYQRSTHTRCDSSPAWRCSGYGVGLAINRLQVPVPATPPPGNDSGQVASKAYITIAIRLRYDYDTTIPRRIQLRRK